MKKKHYDKINKLKSKKHEIFKIKNKTKEKHTKGFWKEDD